MTLSPRRFSLDTALSTRRMLFVLALGTGLAFTGGALAQDDIEQIDARVIITGSNYIESYYANPVVFSPDGTLLGFTGDGNAVFWNLEEDVEELRLPTGTWGPHGIYFFPDGRVLTAGTEVQIWDLEKQRELRRLRAPAGEGFYASDLSDDGSRILVTSGNNDMTSLHVWNGTTGKRIWRKSLEGTDQDASSVWYIGDGSSFLTTSTYTPAAVWDSSNGDLLFSIEGVQYWAIASPDGSRIVGTIEKPHDDSFVIVDAVSGEVLQDFGHTEGNARPLAFSPDGTQVLVQYGKGFHAQLGELGENAFVVFDVETGEEMLRLETDQEDLDPGPAAWSPDGSRIVAAWNITFDSVNKQYLGSETILVYDAVTGEPMVELAGEPERVQALYFSPDGNRVATVSDASSYENDRLRVFDLPPVDDGEGGDDGGGDDDGGDDGEGDE